MALPKHSGEDLSIADMVYNRLKFLYKTDANTAILSIYTIEIMSELEACFRVDTLPFEPDTLTNIGDENKYTLAQRVVIADLVCVYVLMALVTTNMAGSVDENGTVTAASPKIITRTVAGSVEVEWEQFDIKKGAGLYTSSEALMNMYRDSAVRKAMMLGCIITVCDGCLSADCMRDTFLPLQVVTSIGCEIRTNVPERNIRGLL